MSSLLRACLPASGLVAAIGLCAPSEAARAQGPAANPHANLRGRACGDCHTTRDWHTITFDHSKTTAPLRGQHALVPCTGCHDLRDFRTAALECRACHQDPHRGDAGARCQLCHVESSWHQVSARDAHANTRLPELGVHAALQCADCHRQATVQQFSGPVARCVECHRSAYLATANPSHTALAFSQQCEACHQLTSWSFALFQQHDAIFPIYAGTHAGVWRDCATCHANRADFTVFNCVPCHTQARTDAGHQGVAGYAWQSAACLTCHPDGRSASFGQHDALFPIFSGIHAGLWTTCAQCHTSPADRRVYSCMTGGCHPQAATDPAHAGVPGYQFAATQCLACHPTGLQGQFTQHDPLFFPVYSGMHAGTWTACAACHPTPGQPAIYTCMSSGCHPQAATDPAHAGIPGYGFAASQCLSCHPTGLAGTFTQHDQLFFPITSGTHAGTWTTCAACHPTPGQPAIYTCMSSGCHPQAATDPAHAGVTGYQYVAAQCLGCHPTGQSGTFTQHDPIFPIFSGTHAGTWSACTACHPTAGQPAIYTCMSSGCHPQAATDPAHAGIPGYQYTATECLACHPTGVRGQFSQHDQLFFPVYSGMHAGTWSACAACHPTAGQPATYTCMSAGCHPQTVTDPGHAGVPGYAYTATQCLACHPTGVQGTFTQHDALFFPVYSGTHAGTWTGCAACHPTAGQPAIYTCMSAGCHPQTATDPAHAGVPGYAYTAAQCLACHPTGVQGQFTQHDALFFPVYSGTHAGTWTACAACHPTPGQPAIYTCMSSGCHPQAATDPAHAGIPGYAYAASQCYACHPTGQPGTFTQHDALFFPIYSGTHANRWTACAACHPTPGQPAVLTCMSSGCHPQSQTAQDHSGVPGYAYTAAQCYACHPRGTSGG